MAFIQFGDISAEIVERCKTLHISSNSVAQTTFVAAQQHLLNYGRTVIQEREERQQKAFDTLQAFFDERLQVNKNSTIIKERRSGTLKLKKFTLQQTVEFERRKAKREAKNKLPDADQVVSSISIAGGPSPSQFVSEENNRRKVHTTPSRKKKIVQKRLHSNGHQLEKLAKDLRSIASKKQLNVEVISTKVNKGKYVQFGDKTFFQLQTKHHLNKIRLVDLHLNEVNTKWVRFFSMIPHWNREECTLDIHRGQSGCVFNIDRLIGPHHGGTDGMFIVRGDRSGTLLDARYRVYRETLNSIEHYSSNAENFWRGFTNKYVEYRKPCDHECKSDFNVERVGEMAAIVWQTLVPSGKITCKQCAQDYADMTRDDISNRIERNFTQYHAVLSSTYADMLYPAKFVQMYASTIKSVNNNYDGFTKIKHLIGDRTEAPFTHINKVNEILIKGSAATKEELSEATSALLEVARYQNNRTENVQQGSLKFFRNKISGKAKVNMKLMCDNQLDENGNFKWGKREYHAKRFFTNYLNRIEPSKGYTEFEIRRFPNGTRKLAIGNLIVSTNFENIRNQLEGEAINALPISNECVSKYAGQFKYPCCCVTHDDGTPVLSNVFMPMKGHLAIGNTGDAKYVDLPQSTEMEMYISKDGYCYINIFLAMLVNVNENDAKDFTKIIRDRLIPELGVWPTMMDLATACYYLTLFFPDTISAELPQILVDHATTTLHVLDSYGSKSTGYHILKADTIGQLIWFAHAKLDSAMKHYKVGGVLEAGETKMETCCCGTQIEVVGANSIYVDDLVDGSSRKGISSNFFSRNNQSYPHDKVMSKAKGWDQKLDTIINLLDMDCELFNHCLVQKFENGGETKFNSENELCYPPNNEVLVLNVYGCATVGLACIHGTYSFEVDGTCYFIMPNGFQQTHKYNIVARTSRLGLTFKSTRELNNIRNNEHESLQRMIDERQVTEADEQILLKSLIKSLYRPQTLEKLLLDNPYLVILSMVSPGVILALHNSGALEWALSNLLQRNIDLIVLYASLQALARKVSVARSLEMQNRAISASAQSILDVSKIGEDGNRTHAMIRNFLIKIITRNDSDEKLHDLGYKNLYNQSQMYLEKNYLTELEMAWQELTWLEKLRAISFTRKWSTDSTKFLHPTDTADMKGRYSVSPAAHLQRTKSILKSQWSRGKESIRSFIQRKKAQVFNSAIQIMNGLVPNIFHIINMCIVMNLLISISSATSNMIREYKDQKQRTLQAEEALEFELMCRYFVLYEALHGRKPTQKEFLEYVQEKDAKAHAIAVKYLAQQERVELQARSSGEAQLERIVAFMALVMMVFSPERSDGIYRTLNKLKGLVRTAEEPVELQGLDDITDILSEKQQTVDFELAGNEVYETTHLDKTFKFWWDKQITHGRTVPHYNTEGTYMEFTRATAVHVANEIAHSVKNDFLIKGTVGSGKSTGLPYHLSKKGSVLVIEPTRPLAENVCRQLQSDPFFASPNLRMRGATVFGSSPITIMTSGYALHYLAHNVDRISEYKFVIIDECHVHDANAMAFRCLLHEYATDCKVLKVSATPPGRATEFETQYPVALRSEESLSFQQFVQQQGTGSNADVVRNGDNILVYVASYNEVDTLSKLLTDKGHRVTKIDGRTMKVGKVEILTQGTPSKKHFVVATNIIENGVTLDVDVVVDFGVKVVPILDSDNRMIRYQKKSISYGERIQRLGRVGRHKAGTALKIGITEKGVQETPQMIATEAAFSCFAYGLPVMTGNVSTSLLSNCTVRQARSMMKFELNIFFMVCLIRFDGSIHAGVHELLKAYKLRESSMVLNKMAIPYGNSTNWLSARQYNMVGQRLDIEEDVRIPFFVNDIPERLYEKLWKLVIDNKGDAGFGRCVSSNVCKIAYTLKTDLASIQRTVKIIDGLLQEEREKEAYFTNATSNSCTFSNFSLTSITNAIKSRYATSHTLENISTLIEAKDKLLHFLHSEVDGSEELWRDEEKFAKKIKDNGVLENVILQGRDEIARNLKLKGKWNSSLITRDVLMLAGVFVGGVWMLYENFKSKWHESLELQGKGKRQRQKLKFQRDRDMKTHFHIHANDETLEHYYGEAYTKKGKKSGKQHGMGKKNRRFVNMYERDEDDFTMIRFVDPVTGKTIDDSVYFDMGLIQGQFGEYRRKLYDNDEIDQASLKKGIEAYVIKDFATAALKADLSPHKPLLVSNVTNNIMGFPEREHELRQTGAYIIVDPSRIPAQNEIEEEENLRLEGKGLINTMRDYNPIASVICSLNNETNGEPYMLYGIGFGSYIITSSHLFQRNNGVLKIKSRHGYYECPNTTQLLVKPLKDRDMILIRMPKDFPPFPQKLKFRQPVPQEMACMVGSLFQDKSITSTVSGQSHVVPKGNGWMWKHWISTQRGQCGLPLVSTKDGYIIGIHTAASKEFEQNYFTSFPEDFESKFLLTSDHGEWVRHWKFNADNSVWGGFNLVNCKPEAIFKPRKEVKEINVEEVLLQGAKANWMEEQLNGNLMAVATCPSQLVTKHVVKGKCPLFEVYLSAEPSANVFFKPLMGAYQKSALNRDAYAKDLLKYAKATQIGNVDTMVFEGAVKSLKAMFLHYGFQECDFVTDEEAIFGALNMKSAVGALYSGKKREYFESFTQQDKEDILKESCKRLYLGKLGVWNGSMKAELRPKEKVILNKTRTFTAAPVDTLLSGKVCVDDFNNQFYSLNIKAPWAVGMTKFFCGWNELLMSLPDDWIYCDADGSQFDSSLSPYLINAVLEVRLEFMEKWDIGEEMLRNLYTEIVYTPVLTPDSTIVKKCKGNNSGQPSTVVDNTMMVILAMIYTLEKLGVKYVDQHKMIRYFVTGDDLLIAIEPTHEHLLDNFSKHFLDLGLNYEFSVRTKKREDLWFMSHCGILREGIYIPKLEKERIVSILEWDRSKEPVHRLEAICAAMIEAWGYDDLTMEIRKFYAWVLEQAPYKELAKEGKAPYLAETALRNLYLSKRPTEDELLKYAHLLEERDWSTDCDELIELQGDDPTKSKNKDKVVNAGERQQVNDNDESAKSSGSEQIIPRNRDQDVNVGTTGTGLIPRIKPITNKLRLPKIKGKEVLDLEFLLKYKPQQDTLSNSVATDTQFAQWYEGVKRDYDISDDQMGRVLDGLMVWCIENGTSPNLNGVWVMMDGEEQVEFNIKPLIEHAKPTFRQIMARFSDAAEAYIAMRNSSEPYMPRYGRIRNLKNANLARYAFDFYQVTSSTPDLAREVHHQMKAAALKGTTNKTFGLDGKVSNNTEDTERHTVDDVKSNTHSFRGMGENW